MHNTPKAAWYWYQKQHKPVYMEKPVQHQPTVLEAPSTGPALAVADGASSYILSKAALAAAAVPAPVPFMAS